MYAIYRSTRFRKDLKQAVKNPRFKNAVFISVVNTLIQGNPLPEKYQNHKLTGEFSDCCECHIQPDVLLIYIIDDDKHELRLVRIGSHAELFG